MRLTVETGPLAGTVVTLDRDQPTLLGSGPDCAIRVQEAGVASQQAVVKALKDQGFGVKALAPGLRLNGADIEASPLQDGDVIELGTTRVAFGQVQRRGLPRIAGYRILDELGRGGMGTVYRAEQVSLHREVALKVLSHDLTQDAGFVAKFVAEARAAAKLQHPNVVQVFDVEHDGDTYFYSMELMRDGSLEDWLKQHGAMPVDRALRVVADAAAGLAYAESLGIVHRDIKPDNLMLDQHGAVKIADLGLAHSGEAVDERAIGTPHFMAPEQVLRKEIDHRADLYALGGTFYRLITGRTPFRGQTVKDILRAQVKDDAEPAHKANPDVPQEVSAIIQKLMAKDPAQRFQTANELLEQLDLLLQPPAKKGLWIGLAAAGVFVAGGAIYWAVNKPTEYVEVEKRYDDPEKQEFANEIKQLKSEAREARATIAVLTARVSDLPDAELAAALDRVAADHAGTAAAAEATQRAQALRRDIEQRNRQQQQRREQIVEYLAGQRRAILAPQDAHDYAGAMRALAAPAPAALADDPELTEGLQKLRDQVLAKAREYLAALRQAVDAAGANKDAEALAAGIDAYGAAVEKAGLWPEALLAELDTEKSHVAAARSTLNALRRDRREAVWHDYRDLFTAPDGIAGSLLRQDFDGVAAAATRFSGTVPGSAPAERAAGLAAVARQAGAFADALERAAAAGQLQFRPDPDTTLQVVRWDRKGQQLVLVDPNKKPAKEQLQPTAGLSPGSWKVLADQVTDAAPGSSACFVGLLALVSHGATARAFLDRLRLDDDTSGTGASVYPMNAALFDQLLARLPDANGEPWVVALGSELQAAQALVAGLRALSERRNLAAASHIEKLLAEHPHSYVVAVLP